METGPTRDASVPSGATQPLSLSSSTRGISGFLRDALGANYRYVSFAPTVSKVVSLSSDVRREERQRYRAMGPAGVVA